ncbi:MAG: hypothetical protein WBE86_10040 [Candidatus Acidiferrales bacterium]
MTDAQKTRERALEEAVSRAVRDNLIPLQRTLEDLQQSYADLVSACSSTRPTNALPAMLRAQATSASLTASLSVLSSFITNVMQQRDRELSEQESAEGVHAVGVEVAQLLPAPEMPPREISAPHAQEAALTEEPAVERDEAPAEAPAQVQESATAEPVEETVYVHEPIVEESQVTPAPETASEPAVEEPAAVFDVASLPASEQELHKRANRVAKVSMQDITMLKPEEVRKGREKKDICIRLRGELDKARKEYDRRFQKILDHPVDYFHHWLVEILGNGDPETLGEYPYPSPVLRR